MHRDTARERRVLEEEPSSSFGQATFVCSGAKYFTARERLRLTVVMVNIKDHCKPTLLKIFVITAFLPLIVLGFFFSSHSSMRKLVLTSRRAAAEMGDTWKRPVIIAGPSGVGKGTLISKLVKERGDKYALAVSHTTRERRPGEENGVHYWFTDKTKMLSDVAAGLFLEHAKVHNNLYGTSIQAVQDCRDSKRVCVLDIDVQGVKSLKEKAQEDLDPVLIFIAPPSMEILSERLRGRGTETEEALSTRLSTAASEIETGQTPGLFDFVIINDDVDEAFTELASTLDDIYPSVRAVLD